MFMLNCFYIYFVVFSMCSDKSNQNHLIIEIYFHNKSVSIPFYIEHNPVVAHNTCTWIVRFYFVRRCPLGFWSLLKPCFQLLFTIIMFLPKFSEYFLGNYSQLYCFVKSNKKLPFWEFVFFWLLKVLGCVFLPTFRALCRLGHCIPYVQRRSWLDNLKLKII